jgi:hypothetical protein
MWTLALISSLVRALAWPAAVVVLCLIFRVRLRDILDALARRIPKLKTVEGFGAKAIFDSDGLADLRTQVTQAAAADIFAPVVASATERTTRWYLRSPARPRRFDALWQSDAADLTVDAAGHGYTASPPSLASRYRLRAMKIVRAAGDTAPAATVLGAWSCVDSLIRELAELLRIADDGSFRS